MKSMHVKKTANRIFLPMEHLGVYLLKHVCMFQIELEFGNVGFLGEGKTRVPGEKPLGAKERTNNKLKSHGVNAKISTWATRVGGGGAGGGGECSPHCRSLAPQVLSWVWMLLHYTFTCYDLYALLLYDLRSLHMVSISSCFSVTMDAEFHICWSVFVFLHLSVNSWEIYMQTQWMSFCLVNGNWK